jgi:hypothetical protein
MCSAKLFQYVYVIDSFNRKNNSIIDFAVVNKFLKLNHIDMFDNNTECLDENSFLIGQGAIIVINTKWKHMNQAIQLAVSIRNKFGCDISVSMTDDDGCNEYQFFRGVDCEKKNK